jgi:hypothetical protein
MCSSKKSFVRDGHLLETFIGSKLDLSTELLIVIQWLVAISPRALSALQGMFFDVMAKQSLHLMV